MKTLNKIFFAAIATMAMTACNNEIGEQQVNNSGIINFRMGIGTPSSSRITMEDNSYAATFAANDEVGVFVKDNNSYVNVKYTTKDGTNWDGGPINAPADEAFSYTFYAYHPYQESNNDARNITTTVATNQETEGYIKNDFLISTATTSNTTVNLPFDHALSLVEVRLTGTGAAEGATVSMLNVATGATIDLTTETEPTVTTTGESNNTVIMDALSGVSMKYRAIIPAQEIQANTPIFKIEVNNKTYNASFTSNVKFEKGKYLAMFITIGKEEGTAEVEITTGATINDWTEGDGGDVSVEEVPIILPLGDALTDVTTAPTSLTEDTWFGLKRKADEPGDISYSIETDETLTWKKAAKLSYTSTWDASANEGNGKAINNSWYIATLGYYHCSTDASINGGIYKVTMKTKGETDDTGTISKVSICCRSKGNAAAFSIASSISAINTHAQSNKGSTIITRQHETSETWEEFIFYINFGKKTATNVNPGGSTNLTDTTKDDYSSFDLRFYTNNPATVEVQSNTATIYISDITMEPYVAE